MINLKTKSEANSIAEDYEYADVDYVDSLLVTIDSKYSGFDIDHKNTVFKNFSCKNVSELTAITNEVAKKSIPQNTYRQIYLVELDNEQKHCCTDCKELLENNIEVLAVEPNIPYKVEQEPNDTYYLNDTLWGLNGAHGINTPNAWNYATGSTNVRIGVIDTGTASHTDLSQNVVSGWDFYNDNSITNDDTLGHGAHVSRTIGALGNNGIGVTGVNWDVSIVPMQCSNANNEFYSSTVVSAINYATNTWGTSNQIDTINYSVGGFGFAVSVRSAIQNYQGLFVWCAGNETTDVDTQIALNGSFNLSNLISVGAINQDGSRRTTSNYSSSDVNVNTYAPGTNIYSTFLNNSYGYMSGTSMAAAHVSGVSASLLAIHSHSSASKLKNLILNNATIVSITIPDGNGGTITQNVKKLNAASAALAASNSHYYDSPYLWRSLTQHRSTCECGSTHLEPHVVSPGSFNPGDQTATCILCGGLASIGMQPASLNNYPTSLNGSFILPNGVIVLVDEDIDAYLNGTLVFSYLDID